MNLKSENTFLKYKFIEQMHMKHYRIDALKSSRLQSYIDAFTLNVLISLIKIQVCFKVWYNISTALTRKVLCGLLFTLLYFTLLNQPISKLQM